MLSQRWRGESGRGWEGKDKTKSYKKGRSRTVMSK